MLFLVTNSVYNRWYLKQWWGTPVPILPLPPRKLPDLPAQHNLNKYELTRVKQLMLITKPILP